MEVLRHLRPLGRLALVVSAVILLAAPLAAQRGGGATQGPPWPIKTREHVDLWFHGFALLLEDTATVPFFERGYRDRVTVAKNTRGLYTKFDAARDELAATGAQRNLLLNAQFLALYFGTWEEMQQAFEYFFRAEGDPRRQSNREVQGIIAFLAQQFPRPEDRAWAQRFVEGLVDEREKFFREYWLAETRRRDPTLARVDSLWQNTWRSALQPLLNYTQQQSGDVILSFILAGEGRAIPAGKTANQFALAFPATPDSAEVMLYAFVHEAAGAIARVAVNDHLTPAQQRQGLGDRYNSAGLVRGGALVVERMFPGMGARYARWYLAQMGRDVPEAEAMAALAEAFPMLPEMIDSMQRQIAMSFQGI